MMRALMESRAAAVARMTSVLSSASAPAQTLAPSVFCTGSDSPVIMDSSIEPVPSITTPSNAARSPGSTR